MDKANMQQQAATTKQMPELTLAASRVAMTNRLIRRDAKKMTVSIEAESTTMVRTVAHLRLSKPAKFATIVVALLAVAVAFRRWELIIC